MFLAYFQTKKIEKNKKIDQHLKTQGIRELFV